MVWAWWGGVACPNMAAYNDVVIIIFVVLHDTSYMSLACAHCPSVKCGQVWALSTRMTTMKLLLSPLLM